MELLMSFRSQLFMTAINTRSPYHSCVPVKGFFDHDQMPIFFSSFRCLFKRTLCTVPSAETRFLPRRRRCIF